MIAERLVGLFPANRKGGWRSCAKRRSKAMPSNLAEQIHALRSISLKCGGGWSLAHIAVRLRKTARGKGGAVIHGGQADAIAEEIVDVNAALGAFLRQGS